MTATVAGLLFLSCMDYPFVSTAPLTEDGLRIGLRLPGEPYAYALSAVDENEVRELDVLVFREGGDGREYYVTHVAIAADAIVTDGSDPSGRTKSCTVRVPASDSYRQRIVFLANARAAISEVSGGFSPSRQKEELLADIIFKCEGKWPTESSATFTPFPMWGETGLVKLTTGTTSLSEAARMMRMVARVDVSVDPGLRDAFRLARVYLYNRYTCGRVVPAADALEDAPAPRAVAPSIPAGAMPATDPLNGEYYAPDGDNPDAVTRRLYLMENRVETDPLKATCLVVGGRNQRGETRYYRADLPVLGHNGLDGGFRAFLRNRRYDVVLKSVRGDGYDSPDEAFRSSWKDAGVDVTVWNPEDIIFSPEGFNSLQASPSKFSYLRAGTGDVPGEFSIRAGSPNGWKGEWYFSGNDGSWLHVQPQVFRGDSGQISTYTFTVDENISGEDRHAYLKITAANLTKYLDIYQTNQVTVDAGKDIYDWVESDQGGGPLSEPHRLGVSTTRVAADKTAAADYHFQITTDYTGGYTTRVTGGNDWLTVNGGGGSSGPVTDARFEFTVADNHNASPRQATVEVMAGNLVKRVRIVQNDYMGGDVTGSMEWVEGDQSGSPVDSPSRLGVGTTRFFLLKNAQAGLWLPVATNYGFGYTAEVTRGADWITITANASSSNAWPDPVTLIFDVRENLGNDRRTGKIRVSAGNLRMFVTVVQDIVADVGTGSDTGWEDVPTEDPLLGPYTISMERTVFDCSGERHEYAPVVTITPADGREWTAASPDGWISVLTPSGVSGPLRFSVDPNDGSMARAGSIVVSAGNVKQVIHIRQRSASEWMVRAETAGSYVTDALKRQSFSLYCRADWSVRVKSDPAGVFRTLYTTGGKANEVGEEVYFALNTFSREDLLSGYEVVLEVSSSWGAFKPVEVRLRAIPPYFVLESKNIDIYPEDQPTGYNWYTYVNVADNYNTTAVPGPGVSGQVSPPRKNSCASLGEGWRLPTLDELTAIGNYVRNNHLLADWGFVNPYYYWSATSYTTLDAYGIYLDNGAHNYSRKTPAGYRARCVRDR